MTDASDPTAVRARISVSGRVQGVGYRAFTIRVATQRGLVGGVRNTDDGRVELEAEGPKDRVLSLIEDLKVGPPASRVTTVQVEWVTATGRQTDFRVWY
jgi:acylphosphatase